MNVDNQPTIRVKLDWRAYFKEFDLTHGSNPVHYRGRLLWPDGWQYSSTDYKGPEWAPKEENKAALILAYWKRRRDIVANELSELEERAKALLEIQSNRSASIQQVVSYLDQETGKRVRTARPVDMQALYSRIEWLREDVEKCDLELSKTETVNGQAQPERQA